MSTSLIPLMKEKELSPENIEIELAEEKPLMTQDHKKSIEYDRMIKTTRKPLMQLFNDSFLNQLTINDIMSMNMDEFLKYMSHLSISKQNDQLKRYIHWYMGRTQTNFLSNQIHSQHYFQVQNIHISSDATKYAFSCLDHSIQIIDMISQREIGPPLRAHTKQITSLVFSNDGTKLGSLGEDKILLIWGVNNSKILLEIRPNDKNFSCFNFTKTDNNKIAVATSDFKIILYNELGEEILKTNKGHEMKINCIDFTTNDSKFATASSDNSVKIWNSRSGELILTLIEGYQHKSWVLFSDNELFAGGVENIVIWKVSRNDINHLKTLKYKTNFILGVAFVIKKEGESVKNDTKILIACDFDDKIYMCDYENSNKIKLLKKNIFQIGIKSIAFSKRFQSIIIASLDNNINYSNEFIQNIKKPEIKKSTLNIFKKPNFFTNKKKASTNEKLSNPTIEKNKQIFQPGKLVNNIKSKFELKRQNSLENLSKVKKDENIEDVKQLEKFDLSETYPYFTEFSILTKEHSIPYIASLNKIVLSYKVNTIFTVWEPYTRKLMGKSCVKHEVGICKLALSKSETLIASGDEENNIYIWRIMDLKKVIIGPLKKGNKAITALSFSNNDKFLASADKENNFIVWSVFHGKIVLEFIEEIAPISNILFYKNTELIVTGNEKGLLNLYNMTTSKIIPFEKKHNNKISCIQLSKDATRMISASEDHKISLWEMPSCLFLKLFEDNNLSKGITAIHIYKNYIISGYFNGDIKVWDINTQQVIFGPLIGHHLTSILSVDFNERELIVETKSIDCFKKWRFWNLASKKFETYKFFDVSPDGNKILSLSKKFKDVLLLRDTVSNQLITLNHRKEPTSMRYLKCAPKNTKSIAYILWIYLLQLKAIKIWSRRKILFSNFSKDGLKIVSGNSEGIVRIWDVKNSTLIKSLWIHYGFILNTGVFSNNNKKVATAATDKTVKIWEFENNKNNVYITLKNEYEILRIVFYKDDSKIATLDKSFKILVRNVTNRGDIIFSIIERTCFDIIFSPKINENLYVIGKDFVNIWNFKKDMIIDKKIFSDLSCLKFSRDGKKILTIEEDHQLILWNGDLNREFTIKMNLKWIENLHVTENNELFYNNINSKEEVICTSNFLNNEIVFFENSWKLSQFYKEILSNSKDFKKSDVYEISSGKKGVIYPFYYTFLHVICLNKEESLLNFVMNYLKPDYYIDLDSFFKKDINGFSCLDILFKQKNKPLLSKIISYWVENFSIQILYKKYHEKLFEYLNFNLFSEILKIYGHDTSILRDLFEFFYDNPIDFKQDYSFPGLTKTYYFTLEDPELSYKALKNYLTHQKTKTKSYEYVRAKCVYLPEIINPHCIYTQNFMKDLTLLEPKNPIFENEVIVNMIKYKWTTYGRKFFFREALAFLIFLIVFIIQSSFICVSRINNEPPENEDYVRISYAFDGMIYFYLFVQTYYEIRQIMTLGVTFYFFTLWNIVDTSLIILIFTSITLDILNTGRVIDAFATLKIFNSITLFIGFIRLLSYARGIKGSAFMIRLILKVLVDIRYFLSLMVLFIIGLSLSAYVIQSDYEYNYFKSFNTFFRQMLGDLNYLDDMNVEVFTLLYLLFVMGAVVLFIVMLNLLIAIISDTYQQVSNTETLTRIYEMNNLLYEIDYIRFPASNKEYFKKDKIKQKRFLVLIFNDNIKEEETELQVFKKEYLNNNMKLEKEMLNLEKNNQLLNEKIEKTKISIENKIEEMAQKIINFQVKNY